MLATIGTFDGVHLGHQYLVSQVIREAKARGMQSLIVSFPTHPYVVLHPEASVPMLTTAGEKEQLLSALGVDTVALLPFTHELSRLSARDFMHDILKKQYGVRVLVIGYDHRFGHNRDEGFEQYVQFGKEMGIEVIRAQEYTNASSSMHYSSTAVRNALLSGDIHTANAILNRPYTLVGKVVGGHRVGSKIGFPTANIAVPNSKLIPMGGVYAVSIQIEAHEGKYTGMMNIGTRPTLGNGPERTLEVNIFDFSNDIYSASVTVEIHHFIRTEQKFDTIDDLISQLHQDEDSVKSLMKSTCIAH